MAADESQQETPINIAVVNFAAAPETVRQIRVKRAPDIRLLNGGMSYEIPIEKSKTAAEARKRAGRFDWYKGRKIRELDGPIFKFFGTITAFLLNSMAANPVVFIIVTIALVSALTYFLIKTIVFEEVGNSPIYKQTKTE